MSAPTPPPRPGRRPGFSLLEILVVLAILGLSTALIMPSLSRMLDQATAHAVFFDFQKQVSDLRREASRTGVPITLVDPEMRTDPDAPDGPRWTSDADAGEEIPPRVLELREPWTYRLAPPLEISEGGVCGVTSANLIQDDRVVMTLNADQGDCRFIRRH